MNRFEIGNGSFGPEIGKLGRADEIEDSDPRDEDGSEEEEDGGRPPHPVTSRDIPIRLPGYRELDTRVLRRKEG
ncbi:MAG TPA: hypothetical protein VIA45_07275 [Thermoanaerobaculia bacterium]|jgi:hypothetical protein